MSVICTIYGLVMGMERRMGKEDKLRNCTELGSSLISSHIHWGKWSRYTFACCGKHFCNTTT